MNVTSQPLMRRALLLGLLPLLLFACAPGTDGDGTAAESSAIHH